MTKEGYKQLAALVIKQAFEDLESRSERERYDANWFFEHRMYRLWADILDLDHSSIRKKYKEVIVLKTGKEIVSLVGLKKGSLRSYARKYNLGIKRFGQWFYGPKDIERLKNRKMISLNRRKGSEV